MVLLVLLLVLLVLLVSVEGLLLHTPRGLGIAAGWRACKRWTAEQSFTALTRAILHRSSPLQV